MEKKGKFDYILLETTGLADPGLSPCENSKQWEKCQRYQQNQGLTENVLNFTASIDSNKFIGLKTEV